MKLDQPRFTLQAPILTVDADVCAGTLLNLERMYSTRMLVQGTSQSGKTHMLRYLIEQTHGLVGHLILDWEGELWTLKEIYPEYVWVGQVDAGADLAARIDRARHDCRRLVSAGASIILDLSDVDDDDRYELARLWLEEAFAIHKSLPLLTMVVIAEVHELCPEGADLPCSKIVRRVWARGAKRGLVTLADTQRIAEVHKRIVDVGNYLIGRTTSDTDVERSAKKLGLTKEGRTDLETLPTGTFFGYGPAIGDGRPQLVRSGEIKSRHPNRLKDGYRKPPTAAEISAALDALRETSGDVAEDGSRQELTEEIERLRLQVKKLQEGDPDDVRMRAAIEKAARPLNDQIRALQLQLERAKHHARATLLDLGEIPEEPNATNNPSIAERENHAGDVGEDVLCDGDRHHDAGAVGPDTEAAQGTGEGPSAQSDDQRRGSGSQPSGPDLSDQAAAMLVALRAHGEMHFTRLAELTNRSANSTSFRAFRKELVDAGLAHYSRGIRGGYVAPVEVLS